MQFEFEDTTALVVGAAVLLLFALVWTRIFSRAGYHAAMGLLMLVPLVNVILLFVLAFRKWPVQRELAALRGMERSVTQAAQQAPRRAA